MSARRTRMPASIPPLLWISRPTSATGCGRLPSTPTSIPSLPILTSTTPRPRTSIGMPVGTVLRGKTHGFSTEAMLSIRIGTPRRSATAAAWLWIPTTSTTSISAFRRLTVSITGTACMRSGNIPSTMLAMWPVRSKSLRIHRRTMPVRISFPARKTVL